MKPATVRPEAFFLPAHGGQRFCLLHAARTAPARGAVVFAHPFGEEMNKARRMVALQAQALAEAGYDVLLPDLHGCGDSSGDFADARWEQWIDDLLLCCHWMRARSDAPLWLWGLRAGCLLAAQAAAQLAEPAQLLLWSPTPSGRPVAQQFLRLAAAGELMSGNAKATLEHLRAQLARGEPVEIAGYATAAALLQALERATMLPDPRVGQVLWFDLSTQADATLSPVATKTLQLWQTAGHQVQAELVQGPAFWQTTEIEEAPQLITRTTAAMRQAVASLQAT